MARAERLEPQQIRPVASAAAPDLLDHSRCREPRRERDADDAAAAGFDHVAADDAVGGPVGALHQDVGLDRGDDGVRIVLVEDDDRVDARRAPTAPRRAPARR